MARIKGQRRSIGGLDAIEILAEGAVESRETPTIILLHGFGADMNDLASLAEVIQAPAGTRWIFPNAPLTVPLGGHYEGRAWYPLSISDLQKAAVGKPEDNTLIPKGFDRATSEVLELISALDVDPKKLVIGGFSQGAMVATDVALRLPQPSAGLVMLSSTFLNEVQWTQLASVLAQKVLPRKFMFFQSHGSRDPVLSINSAVRLEKMLLSAGWGGQLLRFSGGHEIPPEVLRQLSGYLRRVLS